MLSSIIYNPHGVSMKPWYCLPILLLTPLTAFANDYPQLKSGLWKVQTTIDGKGDAAIKQCINEDTFKRLLESGAQMMGGACSELQMTKEGGTYRSNINCTIAGSKMVSTGTMSGDFQTSYTAVTKTTTTPPLMGMGNSTQTSTANYLGECEAGMKPGDIITADGKKMNVLSMMDSMPKNMGEMMKNMPDMSKLGEQLQNMPQ